MGDQTTLTWMNNSTPVNAPRIPEDTWEKYKDIILKQYEEGTLEQVINYMRDTYDFKATCVQFQPYSDVHQADISHRKRQYIHRIGQKWGIKKYNKTGEVVDVETVNGDVGDTTPSRPGRRTRGSRNTSRLPPTPSIADPSAASASDPAPVIKSQPSNQPQSRNMNPRTPDPQPLPSQVQTHQQSAFPSFNNNEQPRVIEDYLLNLNPPNAYFWYKSLADILHSLGDHQSAFQILYALFRSRPELSLAILCVRTAQDRGQVEKVRDIIEGAINLFPAAEDAADERSWSKFLFHAQTAHYWGQTGDETNRSEQFGQLVEDYIEIWDSKILQQFTPRPPKLDTTVYRYLYRALLYFNDDPNNFTSKEPGLDIDEILSQFLGQQPAARSLQLDPLSEISCLRACLRWCIDVLTKHDCPPGILKTAGRPEYNIACMLWVVWIQSQGPTGANWSIETMAQLDMSPSELLVTVVCMIIATEPDRRHTQSPGGPASQIIRDALGRARTLANVNSRELLDRFLHQIRETSEQRMSPSQAEFLDSAEFRPFRNFLSTRVPVFLQLPSIPDGSVIHPLTLADPDRATEAGSSRPRRTSGYMSAGPHSPPVDPNLSLFQFGYSAEEQAN